MNEDRERFRIPRRMVSMRLDEDLLQYFKKLSKKTGLGYQRLINMYLRDCALRGGMPLLNWTKTPRSKDSAPPRGKDEN